MKYFCRNGERSGTAYHELFKGEWHNGDGFWCEGSLLIHDEILTDSGLDRILGDAAADYDYYGDTLFFPEDWEEVCRLARKQGGMAAEIVAEAEAWVTDVFEEHGCFTVLGI